MHLVSALILWGLLPPGDEPPVMFERMRLFEYSPTSTTELSVHGRALWPQGGDAVGDSFEWEDMFDTGWGFGIQFAQLWGRQPSGGVYLAFEWETYEGEEGVDLTGDRFEPDEMSIASLMLGAVGRTRLAEGFLADIRLGGGVSYFYDEVMADAVLSNVEFPDLELYKKSVAFVGELGLRLHLGPVFLGTGVVFRGPPDKGTDFTSVLSPEIQTPVYAELGLALRF